MRTSPARLVLPAVGVLVLVAVVAVAATGSTPGGSTRTQRPGNAFLDTVFSLWLVALAIGAGLLVYGLTQRRVIAEHRAASRARRRGITFLLVLGGLAVAAFLRIVHQPLHPLHGGSDGSAGQAGGATSRAGTIRDYHAQFAWIPVLVIVGLAAVGVLAWTLAARRRAQADVVRKSVREALGDVIEEAIDDLRAELDPRRAVIACYARLERALAAAGFPRRLAETQEEHLGRILGQLDIETGSIRRLTDLFTRAKYSQHEVDTRMKDDAIAALVEVRDELRASEAHRQEVEKSLALGTAGS